MRGPSEPVALLGRAGYALGVLVVGLVAAGAVAGLVAADHGHPARVVATAERLAGCTHDQVGSRTVFGVGVIVLDGGRTQVRPSVAVEASTVVV